MADDASTLLWSRRCCSGRRRHQCLRFLINHGHLFTGQAGLQSTTHYKQTNLNQSINQSTDQSTIQSTNNQSINPSINQLTNNQSIDPSTNHSTIGQLI